MFRQSHTNRSLFVPFLYSHSLCQQLPELHWSPEPSKVEAIHQNNQLRYLCTEHYLICELQLHFEIEGNDMSLDACRRNNKMEKRKRNRDYARKFKTVSNYHLHVFLNASIYIRS